MLAKGIVVRQVSDSLREDPALDALEQACYGRGGDKAGVLTHYHSDRGVRYLSIRYTERWAEAGIEISVGHVGDTYDITLAESVIGLYKTEEIYLRGHWKILGVVQFATPVWIDWFNHRCLFEPLGCVSPAGSEHNHRRAWRSDSKHRVPEETGAVQWLRVCGDRII